MGAKVCGRYKSILLLFKHCFAILCLICCCVLTTQAQTTNNLTLPRKGEQPVEVKIGLFILDLTEVNTTSQEFTANISLVASWQDDRLKFDAKGNDTYREKKLEEVWHPKLGFLNQKEITATLPEKVFVTSSGEVIYLQRYIGTFSQQLQLKDFPFDRQQLRLKLISGSYLAQQLKLVQDRQLAATEPRHMFSIPDWTVRKISSKLYEEELVKTRPVRSFYELTVEVERKPTYYLMNIVVPIVLIVIMSWVVFWMGAETTEVKYQLSMTAMLTIIAIRFVVNDLLPDISYLTRMDQFILGSTLLVFFSFLEDFFTMLFFKERRQEMALRLDRMSRLIFPLVFLLIILYAFLL
jgi:hypothetical protein